MLCDTACNSINDPGFRLTGRFVIDHNRAISGIEIYFSPEERIHGASVS